MYLVLLEVQLPYDPVNWSVGLRVCLSLFPRRVRSYTFMLLSDHLLIAVAVHHLQHIEALLKGLRWKVVVDSLELEPRLRQAPHLAVGSPVVQRDRRQVVEDPGEVVLHLLLYVYLLS